MKKRERNGYRHGSVLIQSSDKPMCTEDEIRAALTAAIENNIGDRLLDRDFPRGVSPDDPGDKNLHMLQRFGADMKCVFLPWRGETEKEIIRLHLPSHYRVYQGSDVEACQLAGYHLWSARSALYDERRGRAALQVAQALQHLPRALYEVARLLFNRHPSRAAQ